jgi:hypothetical protein
LTLQSVARRVPPFRERGDLRLSDRCHQLPDRLPARWARLQSVENNRLAPYWLSAPAARLDPCYRTRRPAIFTSCPRPQRRSAPTELSCRSPRVRSTTPGRLPTPDQPSRPKTLLPAARRRPSHEGLAALQRLRQRAATHTEATDSGCAAPSGFLNLLTRYSARNPSGLVSCR